MAQVYFCTKCHKTFRIDGHKMTCSCGGDLVLTEVGVDEWRNMTDDEKASQKAEWLAKYANQDPLTDESEEYSDDLTQLLIDMSDTKKESSRTERTDRFPQIDDSNDKTDLICSLLDEQNKYLKRLSSDLHVISIWFTVLLVLFVFSVVSYLVFQFIPWESIS